MNYFYHPERGVWATDEPPSDDLLGSYPDGYVAIPAPPELNATWSGTAWVAQTAAEKAEQDRALMSLTPRQLLIGLATEGWISEAEAEQWSKGGDLPAAVEAMIGALPEAQRLAARITIHKMSVVDRGNALVSVLASQAGRSETAVDAFFAAYSSI